MRTRITLSTRNMIDAFGAHESSPQDRMISNGLEISNTHFAGERCSGSTWVMELRPGFQLIIGTITPEETLVFDLQEKSEQVAVSVCITGQMQAVFRDIKNTLNPVGGRNSLCFLPGNMSAMVYRGRLTTTCVTVRITPVLLEEMFCMEKGGICSGKKSLLEDSVSRLFSLTPAMRYITKQILNCPYEGPLKRVYFECKALELLFHQLTRDDSAGRNMKKSLLLTPGDRKRIRKARDFLVNDLSGYVPIDELARRVGLNREKLCRGFRELYGKPVFAYFEEYRLNQAKKYLATQEMNITEIAYDLGFAHPCSFTRAFKRRFGVSPRTCRSRIQGI